MSRTEPWTAENHINIISLVKKRIEYGDCKHKKILFSEDLDYVKCGDCGETLNPIWVIARFATDELNYRAMASQEYTRQNNISKKLNEKRRTKCKHCGKMTPVNIDMTSWQWAGKEEVKDKKG